jgi:hypothetical protein
VDRSRPGCFGTESSSDSYSLSANGIASPTSCRSSSLVNVVPLSASVDATVFTAIFLMEQPVPPVAGPEVRAANTD